MVKCHFRKFQMHTILAWSNILTDEQVKITNDKQFENYQSILPFMSLLFKHLLEVWTFK